ncbi:MAG: exopolyphosphatase / guanosine-5-triphosphate,3-diphosphate pyrophosphatase [Thermoleophilaceae bacterium]|nr:exopolyphosphatase / guanosine-5-triphosphate,3-diphosphate pyrophosphatase [Thermoleophilaceae bacterium]
MAGGHITVGGVRSAVIDMGSNSFRLVVYGYEPGRYWQHVDEIREAVRVGQGMGDEAVLGPEPMERAVRTAKVFGSFCRASGIDEVDSVATSAIRSASNGRDLLARIKAASGLSARVLDEAEEARYGYLAIANSSTIEDGFGIDIGGGSVQAMRLEQRRLTHSASWQLGSVRVSEAFLPDDDSAGSKQLKALRKHVKSELESAEWLRPSDGARAVGIGGTIRNLASAAERRAGLPDTDAQGYLLTRDALEELIEDLASMPAHKRGRVPGIKPDRGDVILGGAVVLATLMDQAGIDELEATDAGLREGIFFERFLENGDEPPLFPDVRGASVMNLAHRYMQDLNHPRHVARLSLDILDGLAESGLTEASAEDRELLWAAGMLHDIGTAVDYDDHHKHSRYLILNARLPGFTPRELYLIALIARYHRKGDPDVEELGKLARKDDEQRLNVLAGTIRLAEQLERSRDQTVSTVHVTSDNGSVSIEPDAPADADVAIWSARRNADLLERALDHRLEVAPGR